MRTPTADELLSLPAEETETAIMRYVFRPGGPFERPAVVRCPRCQAMRHVPGRASIDGRHDCDAEIADAAVALLREHQWSSIVQSRDGALLCVDGCCPEPECRGIDPDDPLSAGRVSQTSERRLGHAPTCKLALLIGAPRRAEE